MEEYGFHLTQLFIYAKKRKSILCLLVDCYAMVLYANSTMGRSHILCFVQHFSIFCHESVCIVFKPSLVKSLAAEFKLVAHRVVTVGLAPQTQPFSTSKFFPEQFRFTSIMFFVFSTASAGKEIATSVCSERIVGLYYVKIPTLALSRHRIQSYNSFSASAKYSESVSKSISSYLSVSQDFVNRAPTFST